MQKQKTFHKITKILNTITNFRLFFHYFFVISFPARLYFLDVYLFIIIVLHDKDNRKALPIWIGSAEASAIIRKIENLQVARPMTHDLIIGIIKQAGYTLEKVEIDDDNENKIYYYVQKVTIKRF